MPTPGFQISRSRIARTLVKVEPVSGVDAAPVAGVDDVLTFDSAVIWSVTSQSFVFTPNKGSFTQRKDILTERVAQIRFKLRMAGPGSLTDPLSVLGFKGLDACLQACAMTSNVTPNTSVTYLPSTIDNLKTVTVWTEHHGQLHKVVGCTGNVVFSGNPRTGLEAAFTWNGIYDAPVAVGANMNGYTGGAGTANPMLGINMTIDNGSLYTPVVQSFQFDRGVQIEPIENMNDDSGLEMLIVGDAQPKCQIVIKQDNNPAAGITYADFWANMWAQTTHAVGFTLGSVAGNKISFGAPSLQLIPGTQIQANGMHRELNLAYKVQSDNEDDEFQWSVT